MTKILERETTGSTLERPVEIERPPVEIPPRPELPAPRRPYVRWLGWMLVGAVIAVAGILAAIQGDEVVLDDGSFEANELARMLALAPEIEATLEANGFEGRVATLAGGVADTSFEVNELARMLALAPAVDTSFEVNELARMLALAPAVSDGSFEVNELARMLALAPAVSDGSFEVNELARMLRLGPEVSDGSFEANELARMLALKPEG